MVYISMYVQWNLSIFIHVYKCIFKPDVLPLMFGVSYSKPILIYTVHTSPLHVHMLYTYLYVIHYISVRNEV